MKTIIEPFRIKSIEPIRMTTREERVALLNAAHHNLFKLHSMDLVRLAMPRRVYTQSHADYIVEVFGEVAERRAQLRGLRIVKEPPMMRHFTAEFEPL